MIARVVVRTTQVLDKAYDYIIPDGLDIKRGQRVIVPFGKKKVEGIVVELTTSSPIAELKEISKVLEEEPLLTEELVDLAIWMHKRFLSPLGACVFAMIPAGMDLVCTRFYYLKKEGWEETIRRKDPGLFLSADIDRIYQSVKKGVALDQIGEDIARRLERLDLVYFKDEWHQKGVRPKTKKGYVLTNPQNAKTKKQFSVIEVLKDEPLAVDEILEKSGVSDSVLKTLEKNNAIKALYLPVRRDPLSSRDIKKTTALKLNQEQQEALDEILDGIGPYLLFGVTGSGKTEVYLQAIESQLANGKKALVLVPEIALTSQMVDRFVARFGTRVAVLHSGLGMGERYDEWQRVKNDEADVVVGARSAVFAPLRDLGIIVVDEEHEDSYHQDDKLPYYHARDVAEFRAKWHNIRLVLGSATPAIETYKKAVEGKIKLGVLKERATSQSLPKVHIIDMREELKAGNRSIFSRDLKVALENHLSQGRQVILFLNRRGFSSFVLCRECGLVIDCPNCDLALTYHLENDRLSCHYCDYEIKSPKRCPRCRSLYIKHFGIGTERIETEVLSTFKGVRTLRMDVDTTRRKNAHQKILDSFRAHKADILIGTQMVAKGLDIPNVTLVGVVTADTSLNVGDFRAYEKTFQLLTQVSGRAGRGDYPGEVLVQTYTPEHYAIMCAKNHDYLTFYNKESVFRQRAIYPPYCHLAQILFEGEDEYQVREAMLETNTLLLPVLPDSLEIIRRGPAPLKRLRRCYRYNILLRSQTWEPLVVFLDKKLTLIEKIANKHRVKIQTRIDPGSVL